MNTQQYLLQWLHNRRIELQLSTWEALTVYVTRHLIPSFGSCDLESITPAMCQAYVHDKLKNGRRDGKGGLSLVSVRKHLSVLIRALDDAVIAGHIKSNPARYVRLPRKKSSLSSRTVFLTPEESQSLLKAFKDHSLYPIVLLALFYGLGRSEVLGLQWSSVDFDRELLTIRHTVVKNLTIESKDSTKTENRHRTYKLIPELSHLLHILYLSSLSHPLPSHSSQSPPISPYIFSRSDGSPMRPDTLTRTFQKVLRNNGLPHMRFHDLRHSTASILFDRGWSLEDVKQWLGHADIETTSNIYLHYRRSRLVLVGDDLTDVFFGKNKSPDILVRAQIGSSDKT